MVLDVTVNGSESCFIVRSGVMTKEAKEKLEAIFDETSEYEILERTILPERMICPDCGGITFEGLDLCHLCGGMLISISSET